MKKLLLLLIIALTIGCTTETASDEIVVGFLGPLTGDISAIGEGARHAVELAADEINAEGGINGKNVRVIFEDGQCSAKEASSAGNKLINIDGVKYIIGGGCSSETLAITPVAEENQVIMISPLSSSPDVTDAGDYIFRDYVNDLDAGKFIAQAMYDNDHRSVAVLTSLSDYPAGLKVVFSEHFESLGGEVVFSEEFEQGTSDLKTTLGKIEDADGIFFVDYTKGSITFLKQAEELGLDLPIYGAETFSDPEIYEAVGDITDGVRYGQLSDAASDEFKVKMKEKTGEDDLKVGSSNAYDAMHILAQAITEAGDDATAVKDWLYAMEPYAGESGEISFDENGDLIGASFDLLEISKGESVVVE